MRSSEMTLEDIFLKITMGENVPESLTKSAENKKPSEDDKKTEDGGKKQ